MTTPIHTTTALLCLGGPWHGKRISAPGPALYAPEPSSAHYRQEGPYPHPEGPKIVTYVKKKAQTGLWYWVAPDWTLGLLSPPAGMEEDGWLSSMSPADRDADCKWCQ